MIRSLIAVFNLAAWIQRRRNAPTKVQPVAAAVPRVGGKSPNSIAEWEAALGWAPGTVAADLAAEDAREAQRARIAATNLVVPCPACGNYFGCQHNPRHDRGPVL